MTRVVRLTGGPAGLQVALPWPVDTEWPDILWAAPVEGAGLGAVQLSPTALPGLHRYRKVRQSNLSDGQVEGVRIIRGAEYTYAPVSAPPDPDREAAGEYGPTPEDAP